MSRNSKDTTTEPRKYPTPAEVENFARSCGLTKRDARMMGQACAEAYKSDFNAFRVGCVLGHKNVVMACGSNVAKSDPIQREMNLRYRNFQIPTRYSGNEHSIHAEISAVKSVNYPVAKGTDWKRVKAYVFRIAPGLPYGQGMSKPCGACMAVLKEKGVRYVVYSTDDGFGISDLSEI